MKSKNNIKGMNLSLLLEELETISEKLEIDLHYEKIKSLYPRKGGVCKIKQKYRIIIEPGINLSEKTAILSENLSLFNLDKIFIPPGIRQILQKSRKRHLDRGKTLINYPQ
ncbi:MAG: hypothetical protein ACQES9_08410 [Myxococcota bacterium]